MDAPFENLRSLSGTEWNAAVGEIWNAKASVFATQWADLSHHDQVTIYRILTSPVVTPLKLDAQPKSVVQS